MKKAAQIALFRAALAAFAVMGFVYIVSCGGGGGDSGGTSSQSTGTLSVNMTDAATTDYEAIYITVREVAVHSESSGWTVISSSSGTTYNLLELVNGEQAVLGLETLPAGHYTQLRLKLTDTPDNSKNVFGDNHQYGNYFMFPGDSTQHELKVPSGMQSGIKLVKGFDVVANSTTTLLLDFDASRSVVKAGSSGNWILKPTIKILEAVHYCIIQGNAGQEGVLVSAQTYDSGKGDVTVAASTTSAAGGDYKLFVDPGSYTIVAYKEGYDVYNAPAKLTVSAGTYTVQTFALTPADTGKLTGLVTITGSQDQYPSAAISIRKEATVGGNAEMIEVKTINVENGGTYTAVLPAPDTYTVHASSTGFPDQTIPGNLVTVNGITTCDIAFKP